MAMLAGDHFDMGHASPVTTDDDMDYSPEGAVPDQSQLVDIKPGLNPRDWSCEQLVTQLCRRYRRIKFTELGPLMDQNVTFYFIEVARNTLE